MASPRSPAYPQQQGGAPAWSQPQQQQGGAPAWGQHQQQQGGAQAWGQQQQVQQVYSAATLPRANAPSHAPAGQYYNYYN